MNIRKIALSAVPIFRGNDLDYIKETAALRPFYQHTPQLSSFADAMAARAGFPMAQRQQLVEVLTEQYQTINASEATKANIAALAQANCFTVTTAHQPCLLSGPLYFIYKIVDTIVLSQELKRQNPDKHFIPVYWMGGEDHDFEEVNHFHLFGKRWEWADAQGGAVADYTTESLQPLLLELDTALGDAQAVRDALKHCFADGCDYGTAMLRWVNHWFGQYGLVAIDSRHAKLKAAMIPIFKEELLTQPSEKNVLASVQALEKIGFKPQAHPRAINLFYLQKNSRERIVKEGDMYSVLNTDLQFTPAEILVELENNPQRFSPNVILRPLFQECVLPNLAYVGGGGELAYWLQLKANFDYFNTPFPILLRRSSALWVDANHAQRWEQWGFDWSAGQLFASADELVRHWLHRQSNTELSLATEMQDWNEQMDRLKERVTATDASLVPQVEAQRQSQLQWLDKLEKRLIKTEKQRHDNTVQQIQRWKEKLFAGNGLQERHDNFLNHYLKYGDAFFEQLFATLSPLNKAFVVYC